MKRNRKIRIFKSFIAVLTSFTILATSVAKPDFCDVISEKLTCNREVSAYVDPGKLTGKEIISSLEDLYKFANNYHENPEDWQYKNIVIGVNGDVVISSTREFNGKTYTWYPIGKSNCPFAGKITINLGQGNTQNIEVNEPLFDYIYDCVDIVNINDKPEENQNYEPTQILNLVRNNNVASGETKPLFANHVVHDTTTSTSVPSKWHFKASGTGSYSGIIGTVGTELDNAVVNLNLTINNTSSTIQANDNAGFICGTIKNGATVNVEINAASTGTVTDVTSENANAGFYVGEMCQGSNLNVIRNNKIAVSDAGRTVSGKTYAGGLVGKNDQGTVIIKNTEQGAEEVYDALGTITATDGTAGGVFGYYRITADYNRFSPGKYTSTTGATLSGKTAGGIVGELVADNIDVSYSGSGLSNKINVVSTLSGSSTNYGGIVGNYSNKSLQKTLSLEHVNVTIKGSKATNYGGGIGTIGGDKPVYVKFDDFALSSTGSVDECSFFGGVVGNAGNKGSLLDVGSITIATTNKNYKGGGVVGKLSDGVLRLSGITNLSGANATSGGQIVGERTNALVYALGSGEDSSTSSYENGWRLVRSSTDVDVDDIGTWGEVVRINDIENDIVTYDSTAHTVTVAAAVIDMASVSDFVKTALNMQLNDANKGALKYDGDSRRTTLLSNTNLTVSGTINLSGTGITGFMRDGVLSTPDTEVKLFTGKLSKGEEDAVIKLAVGERYGVLSNGTAVPDSNSNGRGAIHRHRYNGLFARTGDGVEIEDITIDGFMNVRSKTADMRVGGAIAYLCDSATLSSVSAKETINYYYANANDTNGQYVGGLIGITDCSAGKKVTINGTSSTKVEIAPTINVKGTCSTEVNMSIGGVIGRINSIAGTVASQTETEIRDIVLSANIDASKANAATSVSVAGLIADITSNTTDTRKISLGDIDVENTIIKNKATSSTGGILGFHWLGADVTFNNVLLTSNNEINTTAKYIGGLVYKATGHWRINSSGITIDDIAIKKGNDTATPTGLGIILHDGYYSSSGIYMEFMAENSYTLASGLSNIPDMTEDEKLYDEICVCLSKTVDGVLTNNTAGIISYATDGEYSMEGAGTRNSYNNVYNPTVVNNRSRYYYNADSDSYANVDDDSYHFLYWSLNRYATSNIKRCFANPYANNVLSGNYDLNKISYYPIDIGSDVTINNATFVFYNSDIEDTETDSDTKRSTRDGKSQHYMMHMGVFKDVTAKINTTGNVIIYGSVGVNNIYSGALISGTLTGSLNTTSGKTIQLGYYDSDEYEEHPLEISDVNRFLLINKIGDKAVLNLSGLCIGDKSHTIYDTSDDNVYASSLIGDVQGVGITLKFDNIIIDARNKEGITIKTPAAYSTTKSIFSNATLLNKYDVDSTSVAIYNFSQSEDWKNSTTRYSRVTYGKELTDTVEYKDSITNLSGENRYYESNGTNGNYINPTTYPGAYSADNVAPANSAYDFSVNFLPYVRFYNSSVNGAPVATYTLHEIKVNVESSNLENGCGTYDHPYEISGPKQLKDLAGTINGNTDMYIKSVMLPATNNDTHWCSSGTDSSGKNVHSCYLFVLQNSQYEYYADTNASTPTYTWSIEDVRAYLASAYYIITADITLDTFVGLGANDSRYAFKGVVVGRNDQITITNKSRVPFIKISNGSVIKNLKITIDNYDYSSSKHVAVSYNGGNGTILNYNNDDLVYGGIIGKIMGGDNIIDNVSITYNSNKLSFLKVTNKTLSCVGGYVGVIVNGGLIFRNMSDDSFTSLSNFKVNAGNYTDNTNWINQTDYAHLYVNPYIGRVINGYAINETDTYSGDSGDYTLNNGTKNYQIADVISDVTENAEDTTKPHKLYYDKKVNENDRVNIPDGQSLFILSLITQSGAGTAKTASGEYEYSIGYDGKKRYSERTSTDCSAQNVATHVADYDEVGTIKYADKDSGDYSIAVKDEYDSKVAVPYIIYHYTKSSGNVYPARMMTEKTDFMKLSVQGGTYNLPKSFRGIGSICDSMAKESDSNPYQMHIYGFEGNGSTINEQIIFNTYCGANDNYINKVYGGTNINTGMGLFNVLIQKPYSSSTTYKLDEGYYIGNFVLKGKVTVKEYDTSGTEQSGGFGTSGDTNSANRNRYSAGGLASGILPKGYVNLYNLDLNALEVTGTSFVGGYIGRNNISEMDKASGTGASKIYVNGCDTINTVVNGSTGCCGGIVGGSISGYPSIYVNTAEVKSGDTHTSGSDGCYKTVMELSMTNNSDKQQCGIGGIIGTLRNGYNVKFRINNITVKGCGEIKGFVNGNTTVQGTWTQGVGGLFGFVRKADSIIVTNCEIENLKIKAPYAGGLFGNIDFYDDKDTYGTSPVIKIANCKIKSNNSSVYSVEGIKGAGGITGSFTSSKAYDKTVEGYKYDVDGCEVSGYTISQTGSANELCGAGGLFGFARATYIDANDYKMRTVVNTSVHDCIIKTEGSNNKHGMGAVIGCVPTIDSSTSNSNTIVIDDSGEKKSTAKACGNVGAYNIACYDNKFEYNGSDSLAEVGNFVGKSNGSIFKVVSFTRRNNKLGNNALTDDYGGEINSDSYVIDADYMNVSIGENHGTDMAKGFDNSTNVSQGAAKNYFPYVSVSPKVNVGQPNFLTGDGVSIVSNGDKLLSELIVEENEGTAANNRVAYKTVDDTDVSLVKTLLSYGEDTSRDYDIKVTSYFKEMGRPSGYMGEDFPIVAISGEKSTETTGYNDEINAYIRLLTNTNDEYQVDGGSKFTVDVYPVQCIGGVYRKVDGTAGFKIENGKFTMDDAHADSIAGNNQVSMIDIRFLDPMKNKYLNPPESSKTAYHLYIPVLTKKLLKFNFSSTALQGTEYETSVYEAKIPSEWGDKSKLGAGFDSWQTIYAKFEYTKEEMDEFLKTGNGLKWNSAKTLQFTYNTEKSLAEGTEFVLLDNNYNVDKQYYKTKNSTDTYTPFNAYDVIKFSDFKDSSGLNNYEPQNLMYIAADKLKYESDDNGKYVMCTENDATVIAYDELSGDKVYFKKAGDSGTKYTLTVKTGEVITETYYLSMYTYGKTNIVTDITHDTYDFKVECPMTFTSEFVTCQRENEKNTQIYIGNFLEQTLTITEYNDNSRITTDNHVINATLTSTVSFTGSSANHFNMELYNEYLYQNFYLYLNRYNEEGNISDDCTIKGNPVYTYTRTVNGNQYNNTVSGGVDSLAPYFYVEPVMMRVDSQDNWSSVQSVDISLDFGTNEAKLIEEFPARVKANDDFRGIGLGATSKVDFAQARVKYSNNSKDAKRPNIRYYIDRTAQNGVLTLTALDQPEYDGYDAYGEQSKNKSSLGINGKYIETGSEFAESGYLEHIDVGLDYDITNLPDEVLTDGGYNLDFTITLEQKENSNASPGYVYNPVNIEDLDGTTNTGYLDNFKFMDKSDAPVALTNARGGEQQDGYLYYTYSMPLSTNRNNWTLNYTDNGGQKHFTSNLSFDVKTEDLLKAIDGYKYANYRIKVTATISKGSTAYLSEDHVVYTNARVNAEYVVPSN